MDYLFILLSSLALISHSDSANFTTLESVILIDEAEPTNSTVSIINLEKNVQSGFLAHSKNFLNTLDNWLSKFFNRSSLILTIAFILGFITIAIIVFISICVYKNTCAKKRSNSQTKITTNPAYDKIPKVDFLDSSESLDKKIFDENMDPKFESPDSKISSETIRLLDIKSERAGEKNFSNQSIKSFSSSSTSQNSVIEQTPKTTMGQTKPNPSLNDSNIKSSMSSLSKKLDSSHNLEKSGLLADEESLSSKNRFTPNSKKTQNRQQMNIEGQISRRSWLFNRTKSESGAEVADGLGLPPVPPQDKSKQRTSLASSIGSITNCQITMDFSPIKQGVDNILKDIKPYQQSSSSVNFNKDDQVSMSDIYMQCIREKREKEEQAKIQRNKQIESSNTSISMNPNGTGQRNSVANLNQDSESIKTFGTEKSCY
ncbi:hypothetical protein BpHYR1_019920 [Brachionus plicatilis]|uniref:Uncharacterized protein n=1 Tax=Brachionus plicatilis TaxID=10195 RepID=A0A3M7SY51_BRAPC|nr:hypothetical protein BpHYR1_019920 [Brachionus plicatilis]